MILIIYIWLGRIIIMEQLKKDKKLTKIGPYLLLREIGKGAFSVVYEASKDNSKEVYAVKQISLQNLTEKQKERINKEITVLTIIKHPNIISLVDSKQTKRHLYLVFQHCKHTDLAAYIHEYYSGKLPEDQVRRIIVQIKRAFIIMRQNKVVHRDLKLENILVTNDFDIKLADFGFASLLEEDELLRSVVGTPLNMAPEILERRQYNQKCDIWSLGIIIYQMLFNCNPFFTGEALTLKQIHQALQAPLKFPHQISPEAANLIQRMLVRDPSQRISFEEFFEDPWLKDDQIKINDILRGPVLRGKVLTNLKRSNKSPEQKQFIINNCQAILSYNLASFCKQKIENKLIFWANLAKKVIHLLHTNDRLRFFGAAILLNNIQCTLESDLQLVVNNGKPSNLPRYTMLRELQGQQMNESSRGILGLASKSINKLKEFLQSNLRHVLLEEDRKQPLAKLFYSELIKEDIQSMGMFVKIKPESNLRFNLKIDSKVLQENTMRLLVANINMNIKYDRLFKKCAGIFLFEQVKELTPLEQILASLDFQRN